MLVYSPAQARQYLEAFEDFYSGMFARQHFGDHICCAVHPDTVHGSLETIVEDGIPVLAEITGHWGSVFVDVINGLGDNATEAEVRAAVENAAAELDMEGFSALLHVAMDESLMVGSLDSQWEREHDEEILPIRFRTERPGAPFVKRPHQNMIEFWEQRQVLPKEMFDALSASQKAKAFSFAGMAKEEMLNVVHAEIGRQFKEGVNLKGLKKSLAPRLDAAGWAPSNPTHLECLLPSTPVSAGVVRAAHRRWFKGTVIEIVTASGRKFTTTTNHPMLTRAGWRVSGEIKEGDYLVGHRREKDAIPGDHHVASPPTSIANLFETCSKVGNVERIHGSSHQFHGDGTNRYVDIARPTRDLVVGRFPAIRQPLEQDVFAPPNLSVPRFCALCGHLIMVTQRCGFCDSPNVNTVLAENALNGVAAGTESFTNRALTFTGKVQFNNGFGREIITNPGRHPTPSKMKGTSVAPGAALDTRANNDPMGPARLAAKSSSDGTSAQASEIEFDRVLSVTSAAYSGYVFNLSTVHGYFSIDGIYTGNTILRTNAASAQAAGRYADQTQPDVVAALPYWQIMGVEDARQRPTHKAAHGIVLPATDPFWRAAYPPWGYNCRCKVIARTKAWVERMNKTIGPTPRGLPDPGFDSRGRSVVAVPSAPIQAPKPPEEKPQPAPQVAPPPTGPSNIMEPPTFQPTSENIRHLPLPVASPVRIPTPVSLEPARKAPPKKRPVEVRHRTVNSWADQLSRGERNAFERWSRLDYEYIRAVQRGQTVTASGYAVTPELRRKAKRAIKTMEASLAKAPKYNGKMFRGMSLESEDELRAIFREGGAFETEALTSYSSARYVAAEFARDGKVRVMIETEVKYSRAHDITQLSSIVEEREVIMQKGEKFKVRRIHQEADGLWRVILSE